MADSERSRADGGGAAPTGKRREELDQLLQRIAAHIADADKTASTDRALRPSLRQPQPRPAMSMPEASSAMPDPGQAAGTTPAQRDAEQAPRLGQGGASAGHEPALPLRNDLDDEVSDAPPSSSAPSRRTPSAVEPPALRSAVTRQKAARGGDSQSLRTSPLLRESPKTSSAVTDDVPIAQPNSQPQVAAPSPGPAGDEPWDSDAAEALTRTYEADAAAPPLRTMLDVMASEVRHKAQPDSANVEEATDLATTRLIEAARRVEAMLDALAPRDAIDALGARFDGLSDKVEQTAIELQRLGGIETRIGELANKLSDDQIVALFGPLVPTAEDLSRFADDAAGRAADRVLEAYAHQMSSAAPQKPSGDSAGSGQLKALGELLANFMDDRRRSDAETQDALETLQLAMQHLLDRVDQIEPAAPAETHAEPVSLVEQHLAQKARMAAAMPAAVSPDEDDDGAHGHRAATADPEHRHAPSVAPRHQDDFEAHTLDTIPDARGYSEAVPALELRRSQPTASALDAEMPQHLPQPHPAMPEDMRRSLHEAQPAQEAAPLNDRQAFIAMARKAAEKAKAAADAQEKTPSGKTAAPRAPRAAVLAAKSSGKAVGGVRPGVLVVAAVAIVLLAGYWLLVGPRLGLMSRAALPDTTEQVDAPVRQPRTGAQPDIEADDAPGSTRSGPSGDDRPATPRRTSDDAQPASEGGSLLEAKLDTSPSQPVGPGMAVTLGEQPATAEQVLQAREQSRIAALSQRTSFAAARLHPVPPGASPIETASIPSVPAAQPQTAPSAATSTSRQLTLPPATTGPLSLRLAAAQGNSSAQLEIATRLAEGKGVKQNFAEAAQWYERAAAQGQGVAQYRLATLYERGMGVKADREKARGWYQQASDQGNLKAMHNLAVMSASPATGNPDYTTAATLFSKAASHGLADSQYNLGVLYESGLGVPKDHAAAYKWYTLAARGGDQDAARRRDLLISRLPPETLQATDVQIAAWRPLAPVEHANDARVAGQGWKQRAADARR